MKPEGGEERSRLLAKKESFLKENVFKEWYLLETFSKKRKTLIFWRC